MDCQTTLRDQEDRQRTYGGLTKDCQILLTDNPNQSIIISQDDSPPGDEMAPPGSQEQLVEGENPPEEGGDGEVAPPGVEVTDAPSASSIPGMYSCERVGTPVLSPVCFHDALF